MDIQEHGFSESWTLSSKSRVQVPAVRRRGPREGHNNEPTSFPNPPASGLHARSRHQVSTWLDMEELWVDEMEKNVDRAAAREPFLEAVTL